MKERATITLPKDLTGALERPEACITELDIRDATTSSNRTVTPDNSIGVFYINSSLFYLRYITN